MKSLLTCHSLMKLENFTSNSFKNFDIFKTVHCDKLLMIDFFLCDNLYITRASQVTQW